MNISTIKKVLEKGDHEEKLDLLSNLYCLFDSDENYSSTYTEVVNELIAYAISELDVELKEKAFSTLAAAVSKLNIEQVDVTKLIDNLSNLSNEHLHTAIDVISSTHNKEHIPLLASYRHHSDNTVAFSAGVGLRTIHNGPKRPN